MHIWFFATPVIYSYASIPPGLRSVLRLNPMTHVVVSYQQILFAGHFDHYRGLAAAGVVGLLLLALGAFLFDRFRDTFAEAV
jgi:lipopolysaccharide transport system permease protein